PAIVSARVTVRSFEILWHSRSTGRIAGTAGLLNYCPMATRSPLVTYDSTLLDHVGIGAASSAARTSIRLGAMLFLTALTAASAQVSVHLPFTPVPSTLQPMVVLVGAAALGARLGPS